MSHLCAAPGCTADHARADRYCAAHRTRLRRYGHPLQRVVTARDLQPFACRIASRLPDDGEVRTLLTERWSKLLGVVETVATSGVYRVPFDDPASDRSATSAERDAARRLVTTATKTNAKDVADLVIGLAILRAVKPETFADDRAFRFMITRRFFGLSTSNAARHLVTKSTTYKTFPPGLMLAVAAWLWSAFGEVAVRIADMEKVEMEEATADDERLRRSLDSLV